MSRLRIPGAAGAALALALLSVSASPAFAHVAKQEGAYQFTVGWAAEPTYAGVQSAVQLLVHDAQGKRLDNIGDGLKVEVVFSGQKSDQLALQPSFDPASGAGNHGEFDAAIIPTRP